jgi:hypothetical protein
VKNREKQEKGYDGHSFDGFIAVNSVANVVNQ